MEASEDDDKTGIASEERGARRRLSSISTYQVKIQKPRASDRRQRESR